jgi:hypothetical protein
MPSKLLLIGIAFLLFGIFILIYAVLKKRSLTSFYDFQTYVLAVFSIVGGLLFILDYLQN